MSNEKYLIGGFITEAVIVAPWWLYSRCLRKRIVGHESLDNPEIARTLNQVATMPQRR